MRSWGWSPHDRISALQFSSVAQSWPTLQPHESQHTRSPCPSPAPKVYSNSCSSSRWCHPTISSSVVPFSSCPQSLPASGSFPMSQLFISGGQSTGVSASASVLPMNTYSALTRNERNTRASSLSLSPHHVSTQSDRWGCLRFRKWAKNWICWHCGLTFQPPELWELNLCC